MGKQDVWKQVDLRSKDFEEISDAIWEIPELQFEEFESTKVQRDFMKREGFRITSPVCGLETSFIAEWGSGVPVIGFLGENDALPNLSQEADVAEQKPLVENGNGHACGHNLLGTGGMEAACALKQYMEENSVPGTVRYFACPAEEGGGGKVYMAKGGAFDGTDAILAWHPTNENRLGTAGRACITAAFHFSGKAAHAAGQPWNGQSALDAVEIMNVGTQFLREHMLPSSRIHYAITNAGGNAPNVVQAEAEVLYVVRGLESDYVEQLYQRVCRIAEGAAIMTETTLQTPKIVSAYASRIANDVMDDLVIENMKEVLPLAYTEEELAYAKKFQMVGNRKDAPSPIDICVNDSKVNNIEGSTDVADVSWVVPVGECNVACLAVGTQNHSWASTAQGKSSIAHKGMHAAAKIMAGAGYQLLTDPQLLAKVKEDQKKRLAGREYVSRMPDRK